MPCIVNIESSADVSSVALSQDGVVLYSEQAPKSSADASLAAQVSRAVSMADSHALPLDAVALSAGPGSYTGLRIGASLAKGLCMGRDLRLVAVDTLRLLCVPALLTERVADDDALLVPMTDARRMEVYTAVFNRALRAIRPTQALVLTPESLEPLRQCGRKVFLLGSGAQKAMPLLADAPNVSLIDGQRPLAKWMMPLAERALADGKTEDVAYFEPHYLKEFVATKPRKLL